MAHQYMPKIFHGPHKNPPAPSYILNVRSLIYLFTGSSNAIFSPVGQRAGVSSVEVKYDIVRHEDEGSWRKHPNKYSQHKIVDPYLSSMSQTSYSRKMPSRGRI